jgi:hypothetical protein
MHVFDAPMHGKSMNLREFSSKYDPRTADVAVDDCTTVAGSWTLFAWLFPVCTASAMTMVYGLRREATDWGAEAPVLHFFLAALLPLRIYARLCFPEKTQIVWPSLALHCIVMLFAYPYDVERVSGVVFCSVLLAAGFHATRYVRTRSLAANAATLLLLANGVLSLFVHTADSRASVSYYHCSFALLCLAFLSF